jgi:hypothetical protein
MLPGDDGRDQLYSPFTTMVSSSAGISSSSSRVGGMVGMECERRVVLFWGIWNAFEMSRLNEVLDL